MAETPNKRGRPKHCRRIGQTAAASSFAPNCHGVVEQVRLGLDELEALRLADLEGLYQVEAAARMNISRQTLGRILKSAHAKVADSLINGKALKIQGGNVRHQRQGPGGRKYCVCSKCKTREYHKPGLPCHSAHCPNCGSSMLREGQNTVSPG